MMTREDYYNTIRCDYYNTIRYVQWLIHLGKSLTPPWTQVCFLNVRMSFHKSLVCGIILRNSTIFRNKVSHQYYKVAIYFYHCDYLRYQFNQFESLPFPASPCHSNHCPTVQLRHPPNWVSSGESGVSSDPLHDPSLTHLT